MVPFPLGDDFSFSLPTELTGYSSSIGPTMHKIIGAVVPEIYTEPDGAEISLGVQRRVVAWGIVKYDDAFKIARFVRFGFTHYLLGDTTWMSMDTIRHNESD